MAEAWIEDRMGQKAFEEGVKKAKKEKKQPPKRWRVRWRDRTKKLKSKSWDRKSDAEDYRDRIASSLGNGTYRDPKLGQIEFQVLCEEWYETKNHAWARRTKQLYRDHLDHYIIPKYQGVAVATINGAECEMWLSSLLGKPGVTGSTKRTIGPSLVHGIYQTLRGIMKWAVARGCIPTSPVSGIENFRKKKRKKLYLDHHQIDHLYKTVLTLKTAKGRNQAGREVYAIMVLVLAYMGLRIGEAIALKVSNIDLEAKEALIDTAANYVDGVTYYDLPKGDRIRTVGIPGFLVPILRPLVEGREADEFVFTTAKGTPIKTANFRIRTFRPAIKAAGLPKEVSPHSLRHSYASLSVAAGADVKTLQAAMGHASAAMTLDEYADLFPPRLAEVTNVLDQKRSEALALAA